jgi:F0F1-type ATP synthase delta subunit
VTAPEFTAEQLTEGIANALKAHNMEAVKDFLTVLAFVDPHRAQDVMDMLQAGIMIAEAGDRPLPSPHL